MLFKLIKTWIKYKWIQYKYGSGFKTWWKLTHYSQYRRYKMLMKLANKK